MIGILLSGLIFVLSLGLSTLWSKGGALLKNATGNLIKCETCPCDVDQCDVYPCCDPETLNARVSIPYAYFQGCITEEQYWCEHGDGTVETAPFVYDFTLTKNPSATYATFPQVGYDGTYTTAEGIVIDVEVVMGCAGGVGAPVWRTVSCNTKLTEPVDGYFIVSASGGSGDTFPAWGPDSSAGYTPLYGSVFTSFANAAVGTWLFHAGTWTPFPWCPEINANGCPEDGSLGEFQVLTEVFE